MIDGVHRYGQAALAEMYRIILRRQTPMMPGYAVPAWMEEMTRHLPPEQQEVERSRLFEVASPSHLAKVAAINIFAVPLCCVC